eukprot:TRINITY_DN29906_c0_g1_i2.p1 TRINITY_DN29906_c0_g1~~TRINITY_DN29906_c0_g1_i2.p1  ORF type:complete len:481 (+),score=127.55 TRINITY_DN29906_c0_g1_i2:50-1492(+)
MAPRTLLLCLLAPVALAQLLTPFDEEPPEDERPPPPLSPDKEHYLCFVNADAATQTSEALPADPSERSLPAKGFADGGALSSFFRESPDSSCAFVYITPVARSGWLRGVFAALRGRVGRVAVLEKVDSAEATCADLVSAKKEGVIERERCRLSSLRSGYGECKCTKRARSKGRPLLCVPPEHPFRALRPSPLGSDTASGAGVCILRMSYYPEHRADAPLATYTPHRPYPKPTDRVTACGLAYINSRRVLDGTAETMRSWVPRFLHPQNFPLFVFRERDRIPEADIVKHLHLQRDGDDWSTDTPAYSNVKVPVFLGSVLEEVVEDGVNRTELRGVRPRCGCPPTCGPHTRKSPEGYMVNTLRYVLGTRVFTLELLQDERLRQYDFVIKVDWDIRFFKTVEIPILEKVIAGKYLGFHTGYANNGRGCSRDAQAAVDAFALSRGLRARSAGDWAFENDDVAWHSALFMVWTGLVLSPAVRWRR